MDFETQWSLGIKYNTLKWLLFCLSPKNKGLAVTLSLKRQKYRYPKTGNSCIINMPKIIWSDDWKLALHIVNC